MQDVVFVVNPWAGSGRAERVWARLCEARPELLGAAVIETADPMVASRRLRERLAAAPIRRVIALGGDGTLNQVVNVVMQSGREDEVTVALVPVGSGSDLARGLGLARWPRAALKHALHAPGRPLDVLRLTSGEQVRFVANIASAGLAGTVAAAVNAQARRGPAAYLATAARALFDYTPLEAKVFIDGEEWFDGPLLLLAVANGSTFGRGMQIAPHAQPDDGVAEVVLAQAVRKREVLPRLPYLYFGAHLGLRFVKSAPARQVRIEPQGFRTVYETDGELLEADTVEIEVCPGRLRLAL